jgi:hypothetical protein
LAKFQPPKPLFVPKKPVLLRHPYVKNRKIMTRIIRPNISGVFSELRLKIKKKNPEKAFEKIKLLWKCWHQKKQNKNYNDIVLLL